MIEYRLLDGAADYEQAIELQKSVFGFSDAEAVSPLFFSLFRRNNPAMGLALGAYSVDGSSQRLIGLMVGFACFLPQSIYTVLLGVDPAYQSGVCGYKLLLNFREIALQRGIQFMYGVFEPLDSGLARLYMGGVGFVGVEYLPGMGAALVPDDKLLFRWDLDSPSVKQRLAHQTGTFSPAMLQDLPEAGKSRDLLPSQVYMELPSDWNVLKSVNAAEAVQWRLRTRELFNHYVGQHGYRIVDCFVRKTEQGRKFYYLMEKCQGSGYT